MPLPPAGERLVFRDALFLFPDLLSGRPLRLHRSLVLLSRRLLCLARAPLVSVVCLGRAWLSAAADETS